MNIELLCLLIRPKIIHGLSDEFENTLLETDLDQFSNKN